MYIAIDGDFIGARLQQLILEGKLDELKCFSESIKEALLRFAQLLEENGGIIYMNGGDNIFAECTRSCAQIVAEYVRAENEKNLIHFSLAVAENTQDAYIGLNYSKSSRFHYIEVIRTEKQIMFQHML